MKFNLFIEYILYHLLCNINILYFKQNITKKKKNFFFFLINYYFFHFFFFLTFLFITFLKKNFFDGNFFLVVKNIYIYIMK